MSKAKIIAKRSEDNIISEKNMLSKINHPFIVNMHFSFQDCDSLYLVMDYLSGGDLRYHLSHRKSSLFNETQTKFFISNIIIALEYIHSKKIIHRDVKPENLLLDMNGYLRLTDFGIAVYSKKENIKESNGTAGYVAPEVLLQQGYNYSSDYFALGVIGYEFMQGTRPFYTGNKKEVKDLILLYQPKIKSNQMKKGWSENSRDFINKLLQRRPVKRLGYTGIRELKNHSWLKDVNWDLLKNKKIKSPFIPKEGKEYFDKKYCQNEKTHENNKLINVKGYQHVFKNYTFINLDYVSKFVNININKEKKEKEINKEKKINFYEVKTKIKYPINKNKSTSILKLTKKNLNIKDKIKDSVKEEDKNRNKDEVKKEYNKNRSSLNNKKFVYNSNNFLRNFYDLGITSKSKDKKISFESFKNNSCQIHKQSEIERKCNKNSKEIKLFKEKENKGNKSSKDIKKIKDLNLVNKFTKKIILNKSHTNKFIVNKTTNYENVQNIYSTTKKTTKDKSTNILTESKKKDELKKSINNVSVNNNYKTKTIIKNNIKKNIINTHKNRLSKSQILVKIKEKHKSLFSSIRAKDNKVSKPKIRIQSPTYKLRNSMNDVNSSDSKINNHLKSVSNLSKNKNENNSINIKDEKSFNLNKQKSNYKRPNEKKEKDKNSKIKNNIKTKRKTFRDDSYKIRILKFDDYFKNTGLVKDSRKNNFFILDKFKSL